MVRICYQGSSEGSLLVQKRSTCHIFVRRNAWSKRRRDKASTCLTPRERLLEGAEALTDAQLLAILLRVGRQRFSAVQVSMEVLDCLGGVSGLARCGIEELCSVPGVGEAKAAQIKAAIELGKRSLASPLSKGMKIVQPRAIRALPSNIARPAS